MTMKLLSVLVSVLIGLALSQSVSADGKHWAVIVAGSSGYYNYRHQADACHAYHILIRHGIPPANIITMMVDDIAYNQENPFQGNLINHPNGTNVYEGCVIDYKGEDVTPDMFIKILNGDPTLKAQKKKVLESDSNDRVFINFVDHGAPGLLAFPVDVLHASLFMSTLKKMSADKRFKEMVLYIEACESGSMFYNLLPTNIKIYATTAANPHESSYACYMDAKRSTFLGDWYSVKWMEDSDRNNLSIETLMQQFKRVKNQVNKSHVQEYGDESFIQEPIGDFQGNNNPPPMDGPLPEITDAIPSGDVPMAILYHQIRSATNNAEKERLVQKAYNLMKRHQQIEELMKTLWATVLVGKSNYDDKLLPLLASRPHLTSYSCYESAVDAMHTKCFNLGKEEYALRQLHHLVTMCEFGISGREIVRAINSVCPIQLIEV